MATRAHRLLTLAEKVRLRQITETIERETGVEIAILLVPHVDDVGAFATSYFNHVGVGKRGHDNGILILVVIDRRIVRIEVGRGLAAAVTPDAAQKIIDGAIAPEFLELVRYGLRRPKDERVLRSLQGVDTSLKVSLPAGPSWRRYAGDEYGEHEDGSPWDGSGRGRAWPVLTGERARHFFSMGLPAAELVRTLEGFGGPGLMLPEQLWDGPDFPERRLVFGKPNGSACPLGWAHAEYLELLVTIALAGFPDIVMPARRRYTEGPSHEAPFVWSHSHQITRIAAGRKLRVQLRRPGAVHYTFDEWKSFTEVEAIDTTLGLWVAEVPCHKLPAGTEFAWTAHYMTGWEGRNFSLTVE